MIQLTPEMQDLINNARTNGNPCIVATASLDGLPNTGYIGTMMAFGESALAYRDRSGRRPLENIEENPRVIVLFRDSAREVGWKFRCTAEVHGDGPFYEQVMGRLAESGLPQDPAVKSTVVALQIDQILTLFGEVLQERVVGLSW